MRHLEQELGALRHDILEMWRMTISQVYNAGEAILSFNKELAMQVSMREKKIDAYELKIDSACENIIALHQPVAIDLRFVLAVLKINSNLERIADFANGISRILIANPSIILDAGIFSDTKLNDMVKHVNTMMTLSLEAFENEKPQVAANIFSEDYLVDELNKNATIKIAEYIKDNPDRAFECMELLSIFRKFERIGDHCNNMAEEIFFYTDAKVLKHSKKEL